MRHKRTELYIGGMKSVITIVVVIFACLALFYYLVDLTAKKDSEWVEPERGMQKEYENEILIKPNLHPAECKEGDSRTCRTEQGCNGNQLCYGGRWTECQVNRICRPGRVAECPYDSCQFGFRECNECGDGWSQCALPD